MLKVLGLFTLLILLFTWMAVRQTHRKKRAKRGARKHSQVSLSQSTSALDALKHTRETASDTGGRFIVVNSLSSHCPDELAALHLLNNGTLNDASLEACTDIIQSIKRPHPALQQMTSGMSAEELGNILKGCPDITAKILTTVNSAAFGLSQPITSINHAIIYLGLSLVQSIATQFMMRNTMDISSDLKNEAYKKLWVASYVTSSVAFLMAQSLSLPHAAEIATQALLQSIGELALVSHQEDFAEFYLANSSVYERVKKEQDSLGLNAAIVGSQLARKWQLPEKVVYVIEHSLDLLHYREQVKTLDKDDAQILVFCYLSARIGEQVAFNELRDISQFNLNAQEGLDYFYLQEAINDSNMGEYLSLIASPQFSSKVNKLISRVAA